MHFSADIKVNYILKKFFVNDKIYVGGINMDDVFCKIVKGELPAYVVYETDDIISIMDASPFSPGHLLIIPKKHYTTILDMDNEIMTKVHEACKLLMKKMETLYPNLESIKVVVNYGKEQMVKHYHMHLLPLYKDGKKPNLSQEEFAKILNGE